VIPHFLPVNGANGTGPLATDRPPRGHDPLRQNEKVKAKESVKERGVLRATVHPGRLHDLRHAQGPHLDPLLHGDIPLVVAPLLPLVVPPEVGQGTGQAATRANSRVTISWLAIVPEISANTCTWEEVAGAALHHVAPLPLLLSKRAGPEKERVKANQDRPLPLAFAIFTAEASAPMATSASSNTLTLPHLRPKEGLSRRLSLNLPQPLSESLAAMHPLSWPSIVFPMTAMRTITRRKRSAAKGRE